ncbi:MAG: InlB B-repeat-containing protein, partial [Firmicutes bacterium]|nr:InlB B-repeat-containing protein [Bacillota bacterium]MDY5530714.1 InlB B-repeat-containing protein [Pumilibacteraceae bacterium]
FIQGASVTITANEPTIGKKFSGWTIDGISGLDTTQTSLTFNMPANAVTATANYEDIEYTITVNGGKADKTKAKYGESVTITANAPATGKEFDKWVVTGITLPDEDLAKSTVTFEMPASNVTMEAHFRDIEAAPSIEIKVEGGTGGGTYKEGDEVTVTAEDKEGKVFMGWQDASGKIVSTEKSYTFTVNGETTLTAVYEDESSGGGEITPPAKKDGLSGGAIAGIVIGSVLLAGIGGFAIYWFAISKKTFADLGVALKKGFTAIGNFFKNLGAKIKALFTKKK